MNRDELLSAALASLQKALEAGGYLGFAADVNEIIQNIRNIQRRLIKAGK